MMMTMAMVKVAEVISRRLWHTEGRPRSVGENVDRRNLGRAQAVARRGKMRRVRRGLFFRAAFTFFLIMIFCHSVIYRSNFLCSRRFLGGG